MKYPLMLLLLMTPLAAVNAQDDLPVSDEETIQFNPGLYLSFDDFIHNRPVDFDQVEGDLESFFENPMTSKKLTINRDSSVREMEQNTVWGYTDGKDVFLNRSLFNGINLSLGNLQIKVDPWVKIETVGRLSFILFLTTINVQGQNQITTQTYGYGSGQPYIHSSESNYILNTKDGKLYDGNVKELKGLIADDPELLAEFEKTKLDNDAKFFIFLRKYNAHHPFQFR